jgi:hypothetical protein
MRDKCKDDSRDVRQRSVAAHYLGLNAAFSSERVREQDFQATFSVTMSLFGSTHSRNRSC